MKNKNYVRIMTVIELPIIYFGLFEYWEGALMRQSKNKYSVKNSWLLTSLITGKTANTFIADCNPFIDFLYETEKNELFICIFVV